MQQLGTESKLWKLIIRDDKEIVFEKNLSEDEANKLMIEMKNSRGTVIIIPGFGTAKASNMEIRKSKENWKEFDKYTQDEKVRQEMREGIKKREKVRKYFKENPNVYNPLRTQVLQELGVKEWFKTLSQMAQETLIISKCAILAEYKGLIKIK